MKADLHIHSRYSDGADWPGSIAAKARDAGLEAACVTDHDTLGGYPEFAEAARLVGISTWPGVEIDCVDSRTGYRSEILAYFPDGRYTFTEAFLAASRAERAAGIEMLFEKAARHFGAKNLSFSALVERRSAGRPVGAGRLAISSLRFSKTDFYIALRDAGLVPASLAYKAFKKQYFEDGVFSDTRFEKSELETVAGIVAKDGGALVVPHIGHEFVDSLREMTEGRDRLDAMLKRFKALGVRGVELYDYRHADSAAINALVAERCERYGFFHTYGSDTHGAGSPKDTLGKFYGEFGGFPKGKRRGKV